MAKCRSCGAEIHFLKTPKGKFHPVEGLEPETYYLHQGAPPGPGRARLSIVLPDGTVIQGWQGTQSESGVLKVEGCESHFARDVEPGVPEKSGGRYRKNLLPGGRSMEEEAVRAKVLLRCPWCGALAPGWPGRQVCPECRSIFYVHGPVQG